MGRSVRGRKMEKIAILTDGKAGHENQSKAFARALGYDYELLPVRFKSKFHKALSYFFDRLGVMAPWLWEFTPQRFEGTAVPAAPAPFKPAAVIGAGSGTFFPAKSLARSLGVNCGVVLYPRGYSLAGFDCILAPSFDRPAKSGNVIEIPANLVASDEKFYDDGVEEFRRRTSVVPDIAVIVGGPNKCSTMTAEWMKARLDEIFALPGTRAVTTSRRTPAEVEALIDTYPWDYKLIYSRDRFNPIPAFVKLAKKLFVTAESTGMLSEACTFGEAEVTALDNLKPGPHKFRRFVENLQSEGYVGGNRKIDLSAQFARARELMAL